MRGRPRSAAQMLEHAYLRIWTSSFRPAGRRCRATRFVRAASSIPGASSIRASRTRGRWDGCATPACGSIRSGKRRDREGAGRDLERAVPAVLDRLRGVPEHPRQRLAGRWTRAFRSGSARVTRPYRHIGARAMNVTCFTDATIQAQPGQGGRTHHVGTDVSVVIAAKQEAPSIGDVVRRARRYAGEVLVVVGRSPTARRRSPQRCGASVSRTAAAARGRRSVAAIPHIRTPITVFLDADGSHDPEDIPLLVEPIVADRADHVSASRLRGGSSELHGGFDEFFRLAGSSFITACINWRFQCRLSDSQNGFRAMRTSRAPRTGPPREHDHDRTGDDHQDAASGMADGRGPEPRAPRGRTARRTSASGAVRRATATRWSNTCSSDTSC